LVLTDSAIAKLRKKTAEEVRKEIAKITDQQNEQIRQRLDFAIQQEIDRLSIINLL